jgi:hypothetical protein
MQYQYLAKTTALGNSRDIAPELKARYHSGIAQFTVLEEQAMFITTPVGL